MHDRYNRSGCQINEANLLADGYDEHFKFAFVRNPWVRLVSCYKQKIAPGGQGLYCYEYEEVPLYVGMSFAQFVEAVHAIPDEEADPHFRSQYPIVCGDGPGPPSWLISWDASRTSKRTSPMLSRSSSRRNYVCHTFCHTAPGTTAHLPISTTGVSPRSFTNGTGKTQRFSAIRLPGQRECFFTSMAPLP